MSDNIYLLTPSSICHCWVSQIYEAYDNLGFFSQRFQRGEGFTMAGTKDQKPRDETKTKRFQFESEQS